MGSKTIRAIGARYTMASESQSGRGLSLQDGDLMLPLLRYLFVVWLLGSSLVPLLRLQGSRFTAPYWSS